MDQSGKYSKFRRYALIGAVVIAGIVIAIYLWTQNQQANSSSTSGSNLSPIGGGAGPYAGHSGQMTQGNGDGQASNIFVVPFGSQTPTGLPSAGAANGTVTVTQPATPGGTANNSGAADFTVPHIASSSNHSGSGQATFVPAANLTGKVGVTVPGVSERVPANVHAGVGTGATGANTVGNARPPAPVSIVQQQSLRPPAPVKPIIEARPSAPVHTVADTTPAPAVRTPTRAPANVTAGAR